LEKERDGRDWAWAIFGWIAFTTLIIVVVVIVVRILDWWYSI